MVIIDNAKLIAIGAANTAIIFLGAGTLALLIGSVVGILLTQSPIGLRAVLRIYVEVFRGTSAVVQLFWLYFVLPFFGVRISALTAVIVGLGLCFGAYCSEIIRSSILSVPSGQYEAAKALGLSKLRSFQFIILPQLAVIVIPLLENLGILLLKATASASLITVAELTFTAYALNVVTYRTIEIFATILVIYYIFANIITAAAKAALNHYGQWKLVSR